MKKARLSGLFSCGSESRLLLQLGDDAVIEFERGGEFMQEDDFLAVQFAADHARGEIEFGSEHTVITSGSGNFLRRCRTAQLRFQPLSHFCAFRANLREDVLAFRFIDTAVSSGGGNHHFHRQFARLCGLCRGAFGGGQERLLLSRCLLPALIGFPGVIGKRTEGGHRAEFQGAAAKAFAPHKQ